MKNKNTATLGIRILKEEKEALQNEADKRGLTLSNVIKEMISERITKKVDTSSPGKNSPGKNLIPEKEDPENKEKKEFDNLLECAILFKEEKMNI